MRFSRTDRLGDQAAPAGSNTPPKITTHDPGALNILRLLKTPELTAAMNALTAAVPNPSQGSNHTKLLGALENIIVQSRKVSTQIRLVHCETPNGRSGQKLAIHSLIVGEQASGYLRAGLATTDPEKIKTYLAEAVTFAQASQSTGTDAIKLLSQ